MPDYSDYARIAQGLATGADPVLICAACPWDRNCINPPMMTTGDLNQAITDAVSMDKETARKDPSKPAATTVLASIALAGRDTALPACPVLVLRLRSPGGRNIAGLVRDAMQSWADS